MPIVPIGKLYLSIESVKNYTNNIQSIIKTLHANIIYSFDHFIEEIRNILDKVEAPIAE